MSARPWEPELDDEDIDDILPEVEPPRREQRPVRALDLVRTLAPGKLPDADILADEQHLAALKRLSEDTSAYPRFPWADVDALVGAIAPEEMWFFLGRTGHGKSMFMQNAFDHFVAEQKRRVLYIGTEQNPEILKIKWACLRAGVFPKLVLKPTPIQRASEDYRHAMEKVTPELEWVRQQTKDRYAMFATSRYVNRVELERWVKGAVKQYGCELVIVDHIDEVSHGEGVNPRHENTETLNLIQALMREHHIAFLIASQSKRLNEKGLKWTPPDLEDLAENNNKERKAAYVLAGWRPLRRGVTDKELRAVKLGQADEHALYEPDEMGIKLLKTREDSGELGKSCRLRVNRGRLESLDPVTKMAIEARQHGIATNRDLSSYGGK